MRSDTYGAGHSVCPVSTIKQVRIQILTILKVVRIIELLAVKSSGHAMCRI